MYLEKVCFCEAHKIVVSKFQNEIINIGTLKPGKNTARLEYLLPEKM